jgi:siroheme synthase
MGVAAARFVQGRLMMHGARPDTAVTVVENASRPSEKRLYGTLAGLAELLAGNGVEGPAVIFVGLAPHIAEAQLDAAAVATPPRRTGAG